MIVVTVGTQLPFDRLTAWMDRWAGEHPEVEVFAQIGRSKLHPAHLAWRLFLPAPLLREKMRESSLVVAHGGVGTMLTALELGKPIIVIPRDASLGEHRSNHQSAVTEYFKRFESVTIASTEEELFAHLARRDQLKGSEPIPGQAPQETIATLRSWLGALGDAECSHARRA